MRVKICGITRAEDAAVAVEAGVWALGFVFHGPSPRNVDAVLAQRIASQLPSGVTAVAVFRDAHRDDVLRVLESTCITTVQLHGAHDVRIPPEVRVIRACTAVDGDADAAASDELVLLDNSQPGSGTRVDWQAAARLAARRPVVLAGGLTPDNVATAIEIVAPYAVDVSTGVERAPGVKDPRLIRAFIGAVRAAVSA